MTDEYCFLAPDGTPIEGVAQIDDGIWRIIWQPSLAEARPQGYLFASDGPWAEWETLTYGDRELFVDETGQRWFAEHLIENGADPLPAGAVAAMRREIALAELRHRIEQAAMIAGQLGEEGLTLLIDPANDLAQAMIEDARDAAVRLAQQGKGN